MNQFGVDVFIYLECIICVIITKTLRSSNCRKNASSSSNRYRLLLSVEKSSSSVDTPLNFPVGVLSKFIMHDCIAFKHSYQCLRLEVVNCRYYMSFALKLIVQLPTTAIDISIASKMFQILVMRFVMIFGSILPFYKVFPIKYKISISNKRRNRYQYFKS